MKARPQKHTSYISLGISIIVAIVCALMIPLVNVNSDMTKYLPDDSRMKQGLDLLCSEFGQTPSAAAADVRIMMESPEGTEAAMQAVGDSISHIAGVDAVSVTRGHGHTLFELHVAKSVNQKRLAKKIAATFPYNCVTQTSQDGNTPDPKALVLAVICLVVILLIMSKSFLEPVLFLATTGMAVGVNMGTNALLDSVSITTHSIAAVLQLALSMDYSIILMNRYRQQLATAGDKFEAMRVAAKKAAPAILSSSFTTVVGLLMLVFMNLKIGKDLGVVLAKGVLCSLIYAYTALPGLILLCNDGIKATAKKAPIFNTDRIADTCRKIRVPLAIIFVVLFTVAHILSLQTPVRFSTSTPSEIDKVFPKKNVVVLLYPNAQEEAVATLLETAARDTMVEDIFSYPTLMKQPLDAEAMVATLREKAEQQGRGEQAQMLTPELMRLCYYAKYGNKDLKIGFTDLVDFITSQTSNPLLADVQIPDLSEKLAMLQTIREMAVQPKAAPAATPAPVPAVKDTALPKIVAEPAAEPSPEPIEAPSSTEQELPEKMPMRDYAQRLHAQQNTAHTSELLSLCDSRQLSSKMSADQMSDFIGSTPAQTRMVYSLSKSTKAGMTPLEFSHFLVDDLFNRKSLASMVSADQKREMQVRTRIMDAAASGTALPLESLDAMARDFGVQQLMRPEASPVQIAECAPVSVAAPVDTVAPAPAVEPVPDVQPLKAEVREDPRLALLTRMLEPGRKYDASRMARNFRALGENVDDATVSLLYQFYGSARDFNPEWTMTLEEVVDFIGNDLMGDERLAAYIDDDMRAQFDTMQREMKDGVSMLKGPEHSIAAVISNYPDESSETEAFVRSLEGDHTLIGESVMLCEMKDGFDGELKLVSLLTVLAILAIVALTFRSLLTAALLVISVMTSVFINVAFCGVGGGSVLYLAYLVVQSILMGATIDYGILFVTYFRENRDLREAYRGSINTILTSGLIISCVPGAMALLLDDALIEPIVSSLAIGSFAAVAIILFVLPGVLSLVFGKKKVSLQK